MGWVKVCRNRPSVRQLNKFNWGIQAKAWIIDVRGAMRLVIANNVTGVDIICSCN